MHRTVWILGLVSFFTDVSSEMIFPLLPLFVVTVLGATPAIFGLIDGTAETISAILKWKSGEWTDRIGKKKKLILLGYCLSSISRPLIGISTHWLGVFFLRFFDRVGKGIRSSPRDAMIADVTPVHKRSQAFGVHRAMDHSGAVVGPLFATVLLMIPGFSLQKVFLYAAVPALIAVILLFFFLQESQISAANVEPQKEKVVLKEQPLSPLKNKNFRALLFAFGLFSMSQSTDAFLLLKLKDLGLADYWIPITWAGLHFTKVGSSYLLSSFGDRLGYKTLILAGWILYVLFYVGFGFLSSLQLFLILFLLYGIYYGLVEGPEKAWISVAVPESQRGTAFGLFHMLTGIMFLPANFFFGLIWTKFGSTSACLVAAAFAFASILFLLRVPAAPLSTEVSISS